MTYLDWCGQNLRWFIGPGVLVFSCVPFGISPVVMNG